MCSAFISGIPMYVAGSPPSIVATCPSRKPSNSKNGIAVLASATAMVMWSGLRNMAASDPSGRARQCRTR